MLAIIQILTVTLLPVVALVTNTNNTGATVGTPDIDWTLVRSQPNATGSITFAAPNVSEPFSQYNGDVVDGWKMSIAVRAGNLPTNIANATASDSVTGTSISLAGPASLLSDNGTVRADSSWSACLVFFGPSSKTPAFKNGTFGDPDCSSALGSDCVEDWLAAANRNTHRGEDCSAMALPKSCNDAASRGSGIYSETRAANFSGTDILNWATYQIWMDSDSDQSTQYGIAVRGVWPVMIRWQGNGTLQDGAVSPNASLHCVQADNVVTGSELPSLATRGDCSSLLLWIAAIVTAISFAGF